MNEQFKELGEQSAAFQKLWLETLTKTMQAAWATAPNSPPPEILREVRAGLLEALAQSWERFMRSPEFLDMMRQWTEQMVSFRKVSNDLVTRVRKEMQAPSAEDIENIVLAVRHMEKRVLDRLEDMAAQMERTNTGRKRNRREPGGKVAGAGPGRARKTPGRKTANGPPGELRAAEGAKPEG